MKLTTTARKALPASDFAGPERSYPVNDKKHAALAKAFASRFASKGEQTVIDSKANKVLGKVKPKAKAKVRKS